MSRAFFDLLLEEKLRCKGADPTRGYRPMGDESLSPLIEYLPSCQGPDNPPRYPPLTSGAHRRAKFLKTVMRPDPA